MRTHRALSWLHRAEQEPNDHDARFVVRWIAFNTAYANEIPQPVVIHLMMANPNSLWGEPCYPVVE